MHASASYSSVIFWGRSFTWRSCSPKHYTETLHFCGYLSKVESLTQLSRSLAQHLLRTALVGLLLIYLSQMQESITCQQHCIWSPPFMISTYTAPISLTKEYSTFPPCWWKTTLQHLILTSCSISENGVAHLSSALQHNTSTSLLNLCDNKDITDAGAVALSGMLKKTRHWRCYSCTRRH